MLEYRKIDQWAEALRRKLRAIKNNIRAVRRLFAGNSSQTAFKPEMTTPTIHAGDRVRVISSEKMASMVGGSMRYKGAPFVQEMYRYCGMEFRVLDEVHYFYDEVKDKLCRCKDLVILENVFCHGKKRLYLRACDLHCYLFWPKDFLEEV